MKEQVDGRKQYSIDKLEYFTQALNDALPKVFARHSLKELTGGALNGKTIANIMSDPEQDGPPSFKVGRAVCFEKLSFIQWLCNSGKIQLNN